MKIKNEHNLPVQILDLITKLLDTRESIYKRQPYYARLIDTQAAINQAIAAYDNEFKKSSGKR